MSRFKKSTLIGFILIAIMLLSTFSYAVLQSVNSPNVELPESNVIEYRLEPDLKDAMIRYGVTFITFDYNLGCQNCIQQKSFLESVANEYKQQIFLEELKDDSLDVSKITVSSVYGEHELVNANETEILKSLCDFMVSPPVTCALI
ncbi:MAG: hypothetical protein HYW24_02945 [Candidatus Aenigmarchaeota archaeon]|nr:hypothetical protein [Candidatus Aenigmarchaeota archaeon]